MEVGKRAGVAVVFDGGPRDVPTVDGGKRVGMPVPLGLAFAHGAFVDGMPGAPDWPVQLVSGPGKEALGLTGVRCVELESHGAFVPALSFASCAGLVVDVGTVDGGLGADVSLAPWNDGWDDGCEFVCVVAIGIGAFGFCIHGNRDPNGKCCTTGNFDNTSALYILIIPLFIFAQPAVTPDMSKRIGECSQNGPRLTS